MVSKKAYDVELIEGKVTYKVSGKLTGVVIDRKEPYIRFDTGERYDVSLIEAQKSAVVNVFPIAAITRDLQGEELTDMADLIDAGALAFSDDGRPVQNSQVMRRALEYSKGMNALIIDHCEDPKLSKDGVMHEGYFSYLYGLKGIPASSEEVMVARDILLAKSLDDRRRN